MVLRAGVIGDEVEHDTYAMFGERGDELIQVIESAEIGMDPAVVGHVIAPVAIR